MKVKTNELIGVQLDWAVAKCEGIAVVSWVTSNADAYFVVLKEAFTDKAPTTVYGEKDTFHPSVNFNHGGQIIARAGISVIRVYDDDGTDEDGYCTDERIPVWCSTRGQHGIQASTEHTSHDEMYQIYDSAVVYGPTFLIAAMRCYVASVLGDEIEIPDDLQVSP